MVGAYLIQRGGWGTPCPTWWLGHTLSNVVVGARLVRRGGSARLVRRVGWGTPCLTYLALEVDKDTGEPWGTLSKVGVSPLVGDDQARDFRGKTPADVIGEAQELPEGVEPDEELHEIIRRTLAGGMDLAQDACRAAEEVGPTAAKAKHERRKDAMEGRGCGGGGDVVSVFLTV